MYIITFSRSSFELKSARKMTANVDIWGELQDPPPKGLCSIPMTSQGSDTETSILNRSILLRSLDFAVEKGQVLIGGDSVIFTQLAVCITWQSVWPGVRRSCADS